MRRNERVAAGFSMYVRFARLYLAPYRRLMLLTTLLVCLNGSSVYLMAFYARYVVDRILVVPTQTSPTADLPARFDTLGSAQARDRQPDFAEQSQRGRAGFQSRNPARPPNATSLLLLFFLLHLGTLMLLNFSARSANHHQILIGQNITAKLRDDLHRKVLALSLAYQRSHTPGRLLARIMPDVSTVQQQLMTTIITLAQSCCSIVVGITILVISSWPAALIAMVATPLYAIVWKRSRKPIRETNHELRHTNSCLYGLITQKLEAVKAIQAYGRQAKEALSFHRLSSCFFRDAIRQQQLSSRVNRSSTIISSVTTMTIFLFGVHQVLAGKMSLGKMMFVYSAVANLFAPVLQVTTVTVVFSHLMIVLNRLFAVLDEPVPIQNAPDAKAFPKPLRRGITITDLGFTYGSDVPPIVADVSMHIPAGQWACIMGASGCGKTTLLYLLARLYEPTAGTIKFDDLPLDKLDIVSLRENMALVPQEAQLFRGTIRENIIYGYPNAQPEQIMQAAKAAQIHDLIMGLPVKYETLVGEKGADYSGGQRQRLSLARALLTNPDVLLLDDCTSALDAETEQRIQQTLMTVMRDKTAVVVSQRVSMARRCHRIYIMCNGRITEQGSHDELLALNGFYAKLHDQQTAQV